MHRIEKYSEGSVRPLKVRMRSQLTMKEMKVRAGRLAQSLAYKNTWIKRDKNLEERWKKDVRQEAKKN